MIPCGRIEHLALVRCVAVPVRAMGDEALQGIGRIEAARLTRRLRPHHRFMDGGAMAHEILLGRHELLQRRVDVVEIDVGDEAVDAGVDAGRRFATR